MAKAQNYVGGGHHTECISEGGTLHILSELRDNRGGHRTGGWVGGRDPLRIMPLRGSILQDRTCKILSYAENPR